ncbi:MAG: hypothetical protein JOY64_36940 [Alphaproteobacteria bacterium]|nr:hypothetical protein [Alphaproteobacteria bacterium]MBV8413259.1 hypothetical protein [Alphaproteobacteria bacterium]
MKVLSATLLGLALVASTAAAQRADRKVEQPIVRSFNWFSYVAGDDIRSACGANGRSRLRLVYNAIYNEQVRVYEIYLQPDGTAGMTIDVLADQGDVSNLSIADPGDVTNPWRMKRGQRVLDQGATRGLLALLQESAAFGPPRAGLRLPDVDFWWTVASCVNGTWGFQAYHYPTDGFANVKFAAKLFSWDPVPVAVNPPRKLEPAELRKDWNAPPNHMHANKWTLTVGKDGLQPR